MSFPRAFKVSDSGSSIAEKLSKGVRTALAAKLEQSSENTEAKNHPSLLTLLESTDRVNKCIESDLSDCFRRLPQNYELALQQYEKRHDAVAKCIRTVARSLHHNKELSDWRHCYKGDEAGFRNHINVVFALTEIDQTGYFADKMTLKKRYNLNSTLQSAIFFKLYVQDPAMTMQEEDVTKKLRRLRLLKPNGKLYFAFRKHELSAVESKCIEPVFRKTITVEEFIHGRVTLDELEKLRASCNIDKLRENAEGSIWTQRTLKYEAEDLVLPLWTFNELCAENARNHEQCSQSLIASVVAEAFLQNYHIANCPGYECE